VNELRNKFDYPNIDTLQNPLLLGGGGGMAHILIVSTSEPAEIQEKADYVVNEANAAPELQAIFDSVDEVWSIWMAGRFTLNSDVTTPIGCWIRGLGYTPSPVA
jgi:hypothetical protein